MLHEPLLLRGQHFGVLGHFRLALEDHAAVKRGREHRVRRVYPMRWNGSVDFIHFERAFLAGTQVGELFVVAMQMDFDCRPQEQEGVQPDVRLPIRGHGDQAAHVLFAHEVAEHVFRNVRVVIVEDHDRSLAAAPSVRQSQPARNDRPPAGAARYSARPLKSCVGIVERSMSSTQRRLTAAISLPFGSTPRPWVWMPQCLQN
jgi:hypothetical protein